MILKDYNITEYKDSFIWIGEIPNNNSDWVIYWFLKPRETSLIKLLHGFDLEIKGDECEKLIEKLKFDESKTHLTYLNGIFYCKHERKYLLIFGKNDLRKTFNINLFSF